MIIRLSDILLTLIIILWWEEVRSSAKTRLTWVNGIAYNLNDMAEGQEFISRMFGNKPCIYCYNPTGMAHEQDLIGYVSDLTQAGTHKYMGRITDEVNNLAKHLKLAVEAVGPDGCVIHIAHSQGALITSLAAKQLTAKEMSQIEVLSFGGAAAIRKTPQTPFRRCINYYSVNDPLLFIVPSATQALRSGFVGNEEFCFLAPKLGDPIADHNLVAPTYAQALAWEGARFRKVYDSFLRFALRSAKIYALAIFIQLVDILRRFLLSVTRPLLRVCVAIYVASRDAAQGIDSTIKILIRPIAFLLCLVYEFVQTALRNLLDKDKFVPVSDVMTKKEDPQPPIQSSLGRKLQLIQFNRR